MSTAPPDDRLDGPIHGWFGLSYSNYQVLHRTLMQSMPVAWQERMVACLDELDEAFAHVDMPDTWWVQPAKERCYSDLTGPEMQLLGVEHDDDGGNGCRYIDDDGGEHQAADRVLVPYGDDPIPHYGRGRTHIEPRTEDGAHR